MASDESSSCLVARAMPCAVLPKPAHDLVKVDKDLGPDGLAERLEKLSVQESKSIGFNKRSDLSPADFVQLQNIRSSALARKTNTTSKVNKDSDSLFDDLLLKDEPEAKPKAAEGKAPKEQAEKKEDADSEAKAAETETEADLLSRGPVRTSRHNLNFHPYGNHSYPASSESGDRSSPTYYGEPHPACWSTCREQLSNSSTPDTFNSDLGYSSSTSPSQYPELTRAELKGLLGAGLNSELPDALSDFILKYSRRYAHQAHCADPAASSQAQSPMESSPNSSRAPPSVDSNTCGSPMSAGSAPHASPAGPNGGITGPSTPQNGYRVGNQAGALRSQLPSARYTAYVGKKVGLTEQHHRPAKEALRKRIQEANADALDEAWAWTCKCQQYYPGALCYQDADKDTLLHIVTQHVDLPKIYALVEQLLKNEYASHEKPFDMKNRDGITPLFLAVEKRNAAVVDYLLEAGADPNTQNARYERDAPLHYAAARGMVEQVKVICSYGATNLNMQNGMGLTPLLCAVKNHGVFDEDNKTIVNNAEIIHILLKYGADPMVADATNGRTAVHYAVDRLAPEIIDVFKNNLEESVLTLLVNTADNNGETALETVQLLNNVSPEVKNNLGLSLFMCGASNEVQSADDY